MNTIRNRKSRETDFSKFDRVYVDFPHLAEVRRFYAIPVKTIYYNRAAYGWSNIDQVFSSVGQMEEFCDRYGVEFP